MLTRFERSRDALSSFLTSLSNSRVLMEVRTLSKDPALTGANISVKYLAFELEGG